MMSLSRIIFATSPSYTERLLSMKMMFNLEPKKAEFVLRHHFSFWRSNFNLSDSCTPVQRRLRARVQSDEIKIEDDENAIKLIKMQVQNDTKQDNAIVVVNFNLISKYMKPKIG